MKPASIHEIKDTLQALPPAKVSELCLRLARFKKENKELLTYLLFEADNLNSYLAELKAEMADSFSEINSSHVYYAKKTLRKILRETSKQARYIGDKGAEAELLITYCRLMKDMGLPLKKYAVLENIFQSQLKKIGKLINSLHEDLQFELRRELKLLEG
ncbi:hypothetical protein [Flavihumibacter sp. ZG627]|uniref:hypothetical protein n=1 Tax=Flavihumibacter sp. ZG627 TaxID=1463156 RepID=UPI00057FC0DF|nr:hypothetical protein [Flavihumibacter sp. ZG627]KIC89576.1 hypothetical protein HY58_15785 [Flavihumibacter sp. ZG627]